MQDTSCMQGAQTHFLCYQLVAKALSTYRHKRTLLLNQLSRETKGKQSITKMWTILGYLALSNHALESGLWAGGCCFSLHTCKAGRYNHKPGWIVMCAVCHKLLLNSLCGWAHA